MKELNGYYYCFSHSQCDHGLCSIAEIDRITAKKAAIAMGARLYMLSTEMVYSRERKREFPLHREM